MKEKMNGTIEGSKTDNVSKEEALEDGFILRPLH